MRINSKGQVTIPQKIRERFGLLPNTEVEFVASRHSVQIVKSKKLGSPPAVRPWCAA
ncbi:MAG TPA: AbrB/MazE/SpoVT family DNA-binding domain-containing protein [Thermoanaerobaculia bacterium]|jgi:AbrB family looped-hinge helix DNA binding protein|nr:AbrB/MazE/SpoVT family DNA-binding domain-containing protein [Thermoanaerobaculia bacterium]